ICNCFALRWNSVESDAGKWVTRVDNAFSGLRLRGILILWRLHTFFTIADVEPLNLSIFIAELPSATLCPTRTTLSAVNRTPSLSWPPPQGYPPRAEFSLDCAHVALFFEQTSKEDYGCDGV